MGSMYLLSIIFFKKDNNNNNKIERDNEFDRCYKRKL